MYKDGGLLYSLSLEGPPSTPSRLSRKTPWAMKSSRVEAVIQVILQTWLHPVCNKPAGQQLTCQWKAGSAGEAKPAVPLDGLVNQSPEDSTGGQEFEEGYNGYLEQEPYADSELVEAVNWGDWGEYDYQEPLQSYATCPSLLMQPTVYHILPGQGDIALQTLEKAAEDASGLQLITRAAQLIPQPRRPLRIERPKRVLSIQPPPGDPRPSPVGAGLTRALSTGVLSAHSPPFGAQKAQAGRIKLWRQPSQQKARAGRIKLWRPPSQQKEADTGSLTEAATAEHTTDICGAANGYLAGEDPVKQPTIQDSAGQKSQQLAGVGKAQQPPGPGAVGQPRQDAAEQPSQQPTEQDSSQQLPQQPSGQNPAQQQSGQDAEDRLGGGDKESKPPNGFDAGSNGIAKQLETTQRALVCRPAASRALLQNFTQPVQISAEAFITALAVAAKVEQGPVIVLETALQAATGSKSEQLATIAAKPVPGEDQATVPAAFLQRTPGEGKAAMGSLEKSAEMQTPTLGTLRSPFSAFGAQTEISAYSEASGSEGRVGEGKSLAPRHEEREAQQEGLNQEQQDAMLIVDTTKVSLLIPKEKMLEGTSASPVLVGITSAFLNEDEQSNAAETKAMREEAILFGSPRPSSEDSEDPAGRSDQATGGESAPTEDRQKDQPASGGHPQPESPESAPGGGALPSEGGDPGQCLPGASGLQSLESSRGEAEPIWEHSVQPSADVLMSQPYGRQAPSSGSGRQESSVVAGAPEPVVVDSSSSSNLGQAQQEASRQLRSPPADMTIADILGLPRTSPAQKCLRPFVEHTPSSVTLAGREMHPEDALAGSKKPQRDALAGGDFNSQDTLACGGIPPLNTLTGGEIHPEDALAGGEIPPLDTLAGGDFHLEDALAGGQIPPEEALAGGKLPPQDTLAEARQYWQAECAEAASGPLIEHQETQVLGLHSDALAGRMSAGSSEVDLTGLVKRLEVGAYVADDKATGRRERLEVGARVTDDKSAEGRERLEVGAKVADDDLAERREQIDVGAKVADDKAAEGAVDRAAAGVDDKAAEEGEQEWVSPGSESGTTWTESIEEPAGKRSRATGGSGSETEYKSVAIGSLGSDSLTHSSESLSYAPPPSPRSSSSQSSLVALLTGPDLSFEHPQPISPEQPPKSMIAVQGAVAKDDSTLAGNSPSMQAATELSTPLEVSGDKVHSIAADSQPCPLSASPSAAPRPTNSTEGAPKPGPLKESKSPESDNLVARTTWRREQPGEGSHERCRRPSGMPQRRERTPKMPPVGEPGALNFAARRAHEAIKAEPAPLDQRAAPRPAVLQSELLQEMRRAMSAFSLRSDSQGEALSRGELGFVPRPRPLPIRSLTIEKVPQPCASTLENVAAPPSTDNFAATATDAISWADLLLTPQAGSQPFATESSTAVTTQPTRQPPCSFPPDFEPSPNPPAIAQLQGFTQYRITQTGYAASRTTQQLPGSFCPAQGEHTRAYRLEASLPQHLRIATPPPPGFETAYGFARPPVPESPMLESLLGAEAEARSASESLLDEMTQGSLVAPSRQRPAAEAASYKLDPHSMASPGGPPGHITSALPVEPPTLGSAVSALPVPPTLAQESNWEGQADEQDLMSLLIDREEAQQPPATSRQQEVGLAVIPFWVESAPSATATAHQPSPSGLLSGRVTSQWLPQAESSLTQVPSSPLWPSAAGDFYREVIPGLDTHGSAASGKSEAAAASVTQVPSTPLWPSAGGGSRREAVPGSSKLESAACREPEVDTASMAALLCTSRGPLPRPVKAEPTIPSPPRAPSPELPGSPDYASLLIPDLGVLSRNPSYPGHTAPVRDTLAKMPSQYQTADPSSLLSTSRKPESPTVPLSMAAGTWSSQGRSGSGAGHATQDGVMAAWEASSCHGSPRTLASLLAPDLAGKDTTMVGEDEQDIMSLLMPAVRKGPGRREEEPISIDAMSPAKLHASELPSASRDSWLSAEQEQVVNLGRQPVKLSRPPQLKSLPLQERVDSSLKQLDAVIQAIDTTFQADVSSYTSNMHPIGGIPGNQTLQQSNTPSYVPAVQPGVASMAVGTAFCLEQPEALLAQSTPAMTGLAMIQQVPLSQHGPVSQHNPPGYNPNAEILGCAAPAVRSSHPMTQNVPMRQHIPLSQHNPLSYNPDAASLERALSASSCQTSQQQLHSTLLAPMTQHQDPQAVQRSALPDSNYMQLLHDSAMGLPGNKHIPYAPLPQGTRVDSHREMKPEALLGISVGKVPLPDVPPSAFAANSQIPAGIKPSKSSEALAGKLPIIAPRATATQSTGLVRASSVPSSTTTSTPRTAIGSEAPATERSGKLRNRRLRNTCTILDDLFTTDGAPEEDDIFGPAAIQSAAKRGLIPMAAPRRPAATIARNFGGGAANDGALASRHVVHVATRQQTTQDEAGGAAEDVVEDGAARRSAELMHILRCPLSGAMMREPVLAANGQTYERSAIEAHLRDHGTDPNTGLPMNAHLQANLPVRQIIDTITTATS